MERIVISDGVSYLCRECDGYDGYMYVTVYEIKGDSERFMGQIKSARINEDTFLKKLKEFVNNCEQF